VIIFLVLMMCNLLNLVQSISLVPFNLTVGTKFSRLAFLIRELMEFLTAKMKRVESDKKATVLITRARVVL
jgi:hypothetical protein